MVLWVPGPSGAGSKAWGCDLGAFREVVSGLYTRVGEFLHRVVVDRKDSAVLGWRNWMREDRLIHR